MISQKFLFLHGSKSINIRNIKNTHVDSFQRLEIHHLIPISIYFEEMFCSALSQVNLLSIISVKWLSGFAELQVWSLDSNSYFIIGISLYPNVIKLWYMIKHSLVYSLKLRIQIYKDSKISLFNESNKKSLKYFNLPSLII